MEAITTPLLPAGRYWVPLVGWQVQSFNLWARIQSAAGHVRVRVTKENLDREPPYADVIFEVLHDDRALWQGPPPHPFLLDEDGDEEDRILSGETDWLDDIINDATDAATSVRRGWESGIPLALALVALLFLLSKKGN